MSARYWVLAGVTAAVTAGVIAARCRRRDRVILGLGAELAASREREGKLSEQNSWLRAAVDSGMTPLALVPGCGQASLRLASARRL